MKKANRRLKVVHIKFEVPTRLHKKALEAANTFGLSNVEEYVKVVMKAKGLVPKGWR